MRILHTESSMGWGGQEIRVLREAEGMRDRGHEVIFATAISSQLSVRAKKKGFVVYEMGMKKYHGMISCFKLMRIIAWHKIDLVNTHSSSDAWLGGIAARSMRCKLVRTRHLSGAIRKGWNSRILYRGLADQVVTTCHAIIPTICSQARCDPARVRCVATGIDPQISSSEEERRAFRSSLGLKEEDLLIGTVCVMRSWKGIPDFLRAAAQLKHHTHLKWILVGGGHLQDYEPLLDTWDLKESVRFLGHLDPPYAALAAMDVFALLSTANEGISQASLQAAYLSKPLITTSIGGLPEVCLHRQTGLVVPPHRPDLVASAVLELSKNAPLRYSLGERGRQLVLDKFLWQKTLDQMEEVYKKT